ncbi:MAG: hypothetical protein KJ630_17410 [Proteobacteria bacterium]|nr:hypothetical protein [Pseudomonadota bacterium]
MVTHLATRAKFEAAWGRKLPAEIGLTIPQMIDGFIDGSMKGMFIVGEDTMAALSPIYGGLSYQRIEQQDLQWPCPTADHQGTRFLHQGTFGRGLGLFRVLILDPPKSFRMLSIPCI